MPRGEGNQRPFKYRGRQVPRGRFRGFNPHGRIMPHCWWCLVARVHAQWPEMRARKGCCTFACCPLRAVAGGLAKEKPEWSHGRYATRPSVTRLPVQSVSPTSPSRSVVAGASAFSQSTEMPPRSRPSQPARSATKKSKPGPSTLNRVSTLPTVERVSEPPRKKLKPLTAVCMAAEIWMKL